MVEVFLVVSDLLLHLILVSLLTFIVGSLLGWVAHRALHWKGLGSFHRAHMTHHLELYPSERFKSETYLSAGKHSGIFLFAPFVAVFIGIVLLVCYRLHLPFWIQVVFLIEAGVIAFLNDWIHDQTHLNGSSLAGFSWYKRLVALHRVHHTDMSKNLGIFTFLWDRVFRTFTK